MISSIAGVAAGAIALGSGFFGFLAHPFGSHQQNASSTPPTEIASSTDKILEPPPCDNFSTSTPPGLNESSSTNNRFNDSNKRGDNANGVREMCDKQIGKNASSTPPKNAGSTMREMNKGKIASSTDKVPPPFASITASSTPEKTHGFLKRVSDFFSRFF